MSRLALRSLSLAAALLGVTMSGGCGYSLAGRGSFLPEYIRNIGVPAFTNSTAVFDVDRRVTDKVRTELSGRGISMDVVMHTARQISQASSVWMTTPASVARRTNSAATP